MMITAKRNVIALPAAWADQFAISVKTLLALPSFVRAIVLSLRELTLKRDCRLIVQLNSDATSQLPCYSGKSLRISCSCAKYPTCEVLPRSRLSVMGPLSRSWPISMARNSEVRDMRTMPLPFFELPAQCPLLALSGHQLLRCTCLLLTQSGHLVRPIRSHYFLLMKVFLKLTAQGSISFALGTLLWMQASSATPRKK